VAEGEREETGFEKDSSATDREAAAAAAAAAAAVIVDVSAPTVRALLSSRFAWWEVRRSRWGYELVATIETRRRRSSR
jgi:hypothetical protein